MLKKEELDQLNKERAEKLQAALGNSVPNGILSYGFGGTGTVTVAESLAKEREEGLEEKRLKDLEKQQVILQQIVS